MSVVQGVLRVIGPGLATTFAELPREVTWRESAVVQIKVCRGLCDVRRDIEIGRVVGRERCIWLRRLDLGRRARSGF